MEVDEIQRQARKFQRISSNGSSSSDFNKVIAQKGEGRHYPDDEKIGGRGGGVDIVGGGGVGRFCGWPTSRIVRVSRASGGKDRHSKVVTSKGLRDRRVRLSVPTAIEFYDLQDRLGYDQPSKAVEWLLKAAASSIAELPSLSASFSDTGKQQISDDKRSSGNTEHGFESNEVELEENDPNYQSHQQQNASLSKSACSSTSETSKGSGLSLSRSENRIKARERARERAAEKEKEKEKENESSRVVVNHANNHNPIPQNSSFTDLLTGGMTTGNGSAAAHQNSGGGNESNLFNNKSRGQWTTPISMDYLSTTTGLFGPPSSSRGGAQSSSGFNSGQIQLGNNIPQFSVTAGDNHHHHHHHHHHNSELQHFSFVPENNNFVPVAATVAACGVENYNLNFSMSSSGLAGFNRGTLQSNSPSLLPHHLQRFPPMDGSNLPFFIHTTAPTAGASAQTEQFPPAFDAGLQLCYGDSARPSDHKGKTKN